jgi:hypothetical protein
MAEHEAQDARMVIGRVSWRGGHVVDVPELLLSPGYPGLPVVHAQGLVVEVRPAGGLRTLLFHPPGPLSSQHPFDMGGLGPAAVDGELQDELLQLPKRQITAGDGGVDMVLDRLRRVGGRDARERDHAPLTPAKPGTWPHLTEQEVALDLFEGAGHLRGLDDHDLSVDLLRPRVVHVIPSVCCGRHLAGYIKDIIFRTDAWCL